jgi:Anti-sigma-K factor rskA, C-terminal/Putative zinc-finger
MSPDGTHIDPEQCGGNAAPYVLGALTEEEAEAFRRHVESCAVCREEVAALQVVASALPAAAPRVGAPPELKRRVMASVYEDARRRESEHAATASAPPVATRDASSRRAAASRVGRASRAEVIGDWLRWRPSFALAGLAAAAIALAVVALVSGGGGAGSTRVIRAQVLVAHARASLSVSGGQAQLDVANMPQAGPGRVYEVWRKGSGAPQPTDALFTVSGSGGDATVSVPGGVKGVQEVLVTSEPEGGSQAPTRSPVIVARVIRG